MKTIICPNYLKNDLINKLLSENNSFYLLNTKIIPFNAYINYSQDIEDELLYLYAYKALNRIKDDLVIYKNMIKYPAFIKEVVDFSKELITYDISIDTLLDDTVQKKELKKIFYELIQLPFNEKYYQTYQVKEDIQDLLIVDYFTNNTYEYNTLKKMLNNGAKLIKLSDIENSSKSVKFALNNREEIESVAQDICIKENALDSIIICSDITNQLPVIKQVFKRYNIPIQNPKHKIKSKVASDFVIIANLAINKDFDSLMEYLSILNMNKSTLKYIENNINSPFDLLTLLNIENEDILIQINDIKYNLNILLQNENYNNILLNTFTILKDMYSSNNQSEINVIKQIRTIIENCYKYIETKEELEHILYFINKIETNIEDTISKGVIITNLQKPVFNKKYSYVVGCSSKVYPGFKGLKGIFDEKYISNTSYPSLNERHHNYYDNLKWIEHSANEVIFSYHISDLSGKNVEGSFELEKYGKASKWNLLAINDLKENKHTIDGNISKQIFFKNSSLYGSVSSFEQFFSCPYKYFINYGLKIKEEIDNEIDAITIGNIIHEVMEILINKYKKEYTEVSDFVIDEILLDLKNELLLKHPKEIVLINQLFRSIKDNLKTNLEFSKEMENDTSFKPEYAEYKFRNFSINNNEVIINGSIDRIDIAYDLLRIIDYKTGSISLRVADIESAQLLQLVTYLIVACTLLNKKPMGAYYYSFKTNTFSVDANYESIDLHENFIKANRLNGIYFNEDTTSLSSSDPKIIYAHKKSSNNGSLSYLDYEILLEGFNKIYKEIYNKLQEGFIDTQPTKDACSYCPYKSICRYKGIEYTPNKIFSFVEGEVNEVE
ncbi:MAG: hypothetical protein GX675_05785 [Erysipelotrichaceae bacterium]|nr:hypothetical protein [Erysipelotrichaceae bacterium]